MKKIVFVILGLAAVGYLAGSPKGEMPAPKAAATTPAVAPEIQKLRDNPKLAEQCDRFVSEIRNIHIVLDMGATPEAAYAEAQRSTEFDPFTLMKLGRYSYEQRLSFTGARDFFLKTCAVRGTPKRK